MAFLPMWIDVAALLLLLGHWRVLLMLMLTSSSVTVVEVVQGGKDGSLTMLSFLSSVGTKVRLRPPSS